MLGVEQGTKSRNHSQTLLPLLSLREPGMLISRQYVYVNPAELVSINHIQKQKVLANLVLKERVKFFSGNILINSAIKKESDAFRITS